MPRIFYLFPIPIRTGFVLTNQFSKDLTVSVPNQFTASGTNELSIGPWNLLLGSKTKIQRVKQALPKSEEMFGKCLYCRDLSLCNFHMFDSTIV